MGSRAEACLHAMALRDSATLKCQQVQWPLGAGAGGGGGAGLALPSEVTTAAELHSLARACLALQRRRSDPRVSEALIEMFWSGGRGEFAPGKSACGSGRKSPLLNDTCDGTTCHSTRRTLQRMRRNSMCVVSYTFAILYGKRARFVHPWPDCHAYKDTALE